MRVQFPLALPKSIMEEKEYIVRTIWDWAEAHAAAQDNPHEIIESNFSEPVMQECAKLQHVPLAGWVQEVQNGQALKSLMKSEKDLRKRFPNGLVFGSRDSALDFLIAKLGKIRI